MRAAIVQPTYLSWMGFFGLIDLVDVFVFYDDVQFMKRSWQCRNRIKLPDGRPYMLTLPTVKRHRPRIDEVMLANDVGWRDKHWRSIRHGYGKAPHFAEHGPRIKAIYDQQWDRLVDLNIALIRAVCGAMGLACGELLRSSDLKPRGAKTDRLVSVLEAVGATEYVSGPAAKVYMEADKLAAAGIGLWWFYFEHPVYPQVNGDFVSHLAAVDLLFNAGDKSREYVRQGCVGALRPK